VAVAFADWAPHESASDGVVDAYEFWWAPLEDLAQREVMFGLGWGPDEKERWTAAWGRARATAAWLQDEWIANQRRDSP